MGLIRNVKQLEQNISNFEKCLSRGNAEDKKEALDLIKRGICLFAYRIGDEIHFAPSRFLGYVYNNVRMHKTCFEKDGRKTNKAINDILKKKPIRDLKLEQEYFKYCHKLGIISSEKGSFGVQRKFWCLSKS
jgi:hypothetical protein